MDIWAFGCVLHECLTGKRAFMGRATTETMAAVLEGEPDWGALPTATPDSTRFLLRQCLQRDPANRLQDIGQALHELDRGGDTEDEQKRRNIALSSSLGMMRDSLSRQEFEAARGMAQVVLYHDPANAEALDLIRSIDEVGERCLKQGHGAETEADNTTVALRRRGRLVDAISLPAAIFSSLLKRTVRVGRSVKRILEPSLCPPVGMRIDNVHFTITGLPSLALGRRSEIQFWAHMERQRATVLNRARQVLRLPLTRRLLPLSISSWMFSN